MNRSFPFNIRTPPDDTTRGRTCFPAVHGLDDAALAQMLLEVVHRSIGPIHVTN